MKIFNIYIRQLKTMSQSDIAKNIKDINERIKQAYLRRPKTINTAYPCLVAVSKTKPVELILEAYKGGQRHFGENYVQELVEKAADKRIRETCPDINWHYIGHLQSNKINKLLSVQNLYMIQTIDSIKLADNLNNAVSKKETNYQLKVLIQVNTSAESEKHGVSPEDACNMFKYVKEKCTNLVVKGIMTIGSYGHSLEEGPNPDFQVLMNVYNHIYSLTADEIIVSMGMSNDYEHAVEVGSSMVRIGSSVFGERVYQKS
ncbi:pyridoxal phosphate homeostasis protein [Culicoides brevitarsis]|uniref:pyridoxal phosphate homeostasis protein n=1 Tax=Culicoides brevitarsis TaxID=469753 RepID=UPI00307C4BF0